MLHRTLAAVFLAFAGQLSAMEIKTPYFQIKLPEGWERVPGASPDQYVLRSELGNAQITISYIPMDAKASDLQRVAEKLLEVRLEEDRRIASEDGREIFLSEPWSSMPEEDSVQVNYIGRDSLNRHFFFAGFVTTSHITNITGELEFSDEAAIRDFYKEVLSDFSY